MSFASDMERIKRKVREREATLYNNCVEHAFRSIRFGSHVTGAPGQPVKTGALLRSWKRKRRGRRNDELSTDGSTSAYDAIIEDNLRGAQLRSNVGGFHSVKYTRLGWQNIVRYEAKRMGLTATGSEFGFLGQGSVSVRTSNVG